jgi:hypothetical protein
MSRRLLRLLFFAAESGTVAGWIILTGVDAPAHSRGILVHPFPAFEIFWYVSFLTLPVASFGLLSSDRRLGNVGLGTFFGTLILFTFLSGLAAILDR